MFKSAGIALLLLGLAACGAPRPQPSGQRSAVQGSAGPAQPSAGATQLPAAGTYRIDPGNSELRVLVYRAGALARFGHNHVIVNRAVSGGVTVATSLASSSFSLSVPVSGFTVDETQSRREEGSDFPGEIPDDAKAGTLEHMLGDSQLNAAAFPLITVESLALRGDGGTVTAALKIGIAGRKSTVEAPFTLQAGSHELTATGSLELRQTTLGLTPYSLMLGALAVEDAVRIKFKIVASN